ncbi:MAG: outer membrane lipoprotein-sorting protein [Gammaproteobacteria bacterium]|nr:outer membrane lipoprotein-sorting protein [Gammaproteobacteria bacterium]
MLSRFRCKHVFVSMILFIIVLISFSLPVHAIDNSSDANSLMRHIDRLWRSDSAHSTMSMTVQTRRYSRTMKMETWSKGKEKSLIIIREPKKDRAIATLKVNENIWNYLPKINRITKVPPSLMSGSWMGSHFTNDDLVKENTYEDDYNSKISFKGLRDNINTIEITSVPKENAAVVWGKVVTLIDQEKFVPISSSYYNEENILVRVMHFSQLEIKDSRLIPMKMTLKPLDKPGESTIVEYHDISFDIPINDNVFSIKQLKR